MTFDEVVDAAKPFRCTRCPYNDGGPGVWYYISYCSGEQWVYYLECGTATKAWEEMADFRAVPGIEFEIMSDHECERSADWKRIVDQWDIHYPELLAMPVDPLREKKLQAIEDIQTRDEKKLYS